MAHQEIRESQVGTTDTPFGSANAAIDQDTVEAIENLATAIDHDRAAVSTISTTNISFTVALAKSNSDLVDALKMITFLTKRVDELERAPRPTPPHNRLTNTNYC